MQALRDYLKSAKWMGLIGTLNYCAGGKQMLCIQVNKLLVWVIEWQPVAS